ncbi:MAG: hypothetical protein ACKN83_05925 [Vulcanococcus sp.]
MARLALLTLALATTGLTSPAWADSKEAFCRLSRHDHTIPVEESPCRFSREGHYTLSVFWQKPAPRP